MRLKIPIVVALVMAFGWLPAGMAKEVVPMLGGVIIEGYDYQQDIGPKGTIAYDPATNEFVGSYNGLKMPAGRRAIFAWLHDTTSQSSEYVGAVGWLKKGTGGKNKGQFRIKAPEKFKGGNFGGNEIIGFTAERTTYLNGSEVVQQPAEPAGSKLVANLKPAFYLFAALPGADTELHYCGHGEDFFYAKAPEKQFCYD